MDAKQQSVLGKIREDGARKPTLRYLVKKMVTLKCTIRKDKVVQRNCKDYVYDDEVPSTIIDM